jgi:hypothetical protein
METETKQQSKTLAPWARTVIAAAILLFFAFALTLAGSPVAAIFGFGGLVILVIAAVLGFSTATRRAP